MTPEYETFLMTLFRTLAAADCHSALYWTQAEFGVAGIEWYILCPDVFEWGTADAEMVTPENVHLLTEALTACKVVDLPWRMPELFCAMSRGQRPQGAYYNGVPAVLHPLFDACGPERAVSIRNPVAQKKAKP